MKAMKRWAITSISLLAGMSFYSAVLVSGTTEDKSPVTFTKDIAPILQRSCEVCHRADGIAPMSLRTYEESRPWARAIKEKVISRQMPPFHAAGALGRYQHDPRLTDEEIRTIAKWVDAGAPKGNLKDMPPPRNWRREPAWTNGEPDLILKVKNPYMLKASQTDQYAFFVFDYVFPEETWISSIVTRPGNTKVVHHANTHLVPPSFKVPEEGYLEGPYDSTKHGTIMIAGWVPGTNDVMLPHGTAVRIPKGMRFGIEIHYPPNEKETVDQTSLGIYLANGVVRKNLRMMLGDRRDLQIPPGDPNYSLIAKQTFNTEAVIRFFHVHMHLRGKSYAFRFTYPDGRSETLFEVPKYDFNWQRSYVLAEPIKIPKGTQIEFVGTYDNSAKNKFNPDPTQTVRWGEKTSDEMMQGRIFYEVANEDLNLKVNRGKVVKAAESDGSENK
jgi:hypothetical protein